MKKKEASFSGILMSLTFEDGRKGYYVVEDVDKFVAGVKLTYGMAIECMGLASVSPEVRNRGV